jgi:hypothetical protein
VPRLWPILTSGADRPGPRPSWPDVKLMVYVTEWHRFLRANPEYDAGVTVFDQGPIYALVRLLAQGSNVTGTPAFERWWGEMLERWAREIGVVVWLDAPDEVLWGRINAREQRHVTKGEPAADGLRFIARYRGLFEEALDRIDVAGGPMIVRVDTGSTSPPDVAAAIRPMLTAGAELPAETAGAELPSETAGGDRGRSR